MEDILTLLQSSGSSVIHMQIGGISKSVEIMESLFTRTTIF
jgi:hypothetical protein